ncbi:hypothetical protein [Lactobacillus helveticus]|uniref:hypothetical protein n=1 Tax=Lactobacillus helveticus TaxID=1587 RepID=UPI0015675404|nr:hypothetical protein [Lactobacillus helveticus]NRO45065.1 hypothetical protein [Lactobacillus helveticus]
MGKRMKNIIGVVVGVIALACVATGLLAYRNFHRSVQNMHTPVLGQTSEQNSKNLLKQKSR